VSRLENEERVCTRETATRSYVANVVIHQPHHTLEQHSMIPRFTARSWERERSKFHHAQRPGLGLSELLERRSAVRLTPTLPVHIHYFRKRRR